MSCSRSTPVFKGIRFGTVPDSASTWGKHSCRAPEASSIMVVLGGKGIPVVVLIAPVWVKSFGHYPGAVLSVLS